MAWKPWLGPRALITGYGPTWTITKPTSRPPSRRAATRHRVPAFPGRVGVLADDLTGAGDAALALARRGYRVVLDVVASPLPPPSPRTPVAWVINTESRLLSPRSARARVRRGVRALAHWSADFIYKKIDSTLRGPLADETATFLEFFEGTLPVVPAFPQTRRWVRRGRLWVAGRPLSRSPFARDPRWPQRWDEVRRYFRRADIARGRLAIPDVTSARVLARVSQRWARGRAALGSAGFLDALASVWSPGASRLSPLVPPARAAIVVAGSAHPRTREQVARLRHKLKTTRGVTCLLLAAPTRRGSSRRILRLLVSKARHLQNVPERTRWVLTGGETAYGVVKYWRCPRWTIEAEIEPGVPLCRSVFRPRREMVVKPGGFGTNHVFWKAIYGTHPPTDSPR